MVATLGAAMVIYADIVHPHDVWLVAGSVIPIIAWITAFRRSRS